MLRVDRQVAWPLIVNFSCQSNATSCTRADNMGWRYLIFTLGGLTLLLWSVRFFVFRFHESPRYLIGRGQDEEAVKVIHKIAKFNGRPDRCTLTVEDLQKAVREGPTRGSPTFPVQEVDEDYVPPGADATNAKRKKGLLSSSSHLSGSHVKALFATRKMAWSTSLLIVLWGTIGLASTLYNSFLPYMCVHPRVRVTSLTDLVVCRRERKYTETDPCTRHTETCVIPPMDPHANTDEFRTSPFLASDH